MGQTSFQREVLDALAHQLGKVEEYKLIYNEWVQAKAELADLLSKQSRAEAEAAYIQFQYQELDEASFRENEIEELEQEVKLLSNAESVQQFLARTTDTLSLGEEPLVNRLKTLLNEWNSFSSFHADFPALVERLGATYVELQELSRDIERVADQVQLDPQRLEVVNTRLSLLLKLSCTRHRWPQLTSVVKGLKGSSVQFLIPCFAAMWLFRSLRDRRRSHR